MLKKKSIGLNAVLNVTKQICAILFPLISFPYVSRVLQVENYGKVNFSYSIITYFILIAALGISSYAIREGAQIRDNKEKFQKFANEVFTINVLTTILSYILLFILIVIWKKLHSYLSLLLVHSLCIVLTTIGADWINSIFEDYLFITVRYIVIHIISLILMFLLVKKPDDYVIYAFIMVLSNAGAYIFNVFYIRKYVHLHLTLKPNIKTHIKPMFTLFCNTLSVQVYVNSDVTILGILQDDLAVGIYSAAVKIYSVIKQLLNAIITVIIPRISVYLGSNYLTKYNSLLNQTFYSMVSLVMPAITGIFMLSYEIIYIIGGQEYAQGYWALSILGVALVFATFANFFNNAILVPNKEENIYLKGTLIAAITNIVLNIILIPFFSYIAAAFTTLIAEIIVCIYGFVHAKKLYNFCFLKNDIFSSLIGCVLIIIICFLSKLLITNIYFRIIISIASSVVVYFLILLIFKNSLMINIFRFLKIDLR